MRIEILYHYGGIYFDYKVESLKSMQPFLKYSQFFLTIGPKFYDEDGVQIEDSGTLVNGVIGFIINHPRFLDISTK